MDEPALTEVRDVALREVWEHEEHDFTPWLLDRIERLAAAIGIEVEEATRENAVGGYRADIVGREITTGSTVVVENQFGTTDHDHLGKLLTYAAGTRAEFVIWVAERFRDEHRSVLEWLNEGGPTNAKFFGVRPRVISLDGASKRGFEFAVVVEPNDWERAVREESESVSDRQRAYREFYQELVGAYAEQRPDWYQLTAQPQSWLNFGAGIGGVAFGWSFRVQGGRGFAVELYVDTGDGERNKEIYQTLEQDRNEVDAELEEVGWQPLPEKRACRIEMTTPVSDPIEDMSESRKQELVKWGVQNMDELRRVFEPKLRQL